MQEVRFSRDLYAGSALDEAVAAFHSFGTIERDETATHWLVRISGSDPALERSLAGELGNFALGLTAQNRGTAP